MTGNLDKIDNMLVIRYWRSVSHKGHVSFFLPLHPDDALDVEFGLQLKDKNVHFEIVPIRSLLGNTFVAKIKAYD